MYSVAQKIDCMHVQWQKHRVGTDKSKEKQKYFSTYFIGASLHVNLFPLFLIFFHCEKWSKGLVSNAMTFLCTHIRLFLQMNTSVSRVQVWLFPHRVVWSKRSFVENCGDFSIWTIKVVLPAQPVLGWAHADPTSLYMKWPWLPQAFMPSCVIKWDNVHRLFPLTRSSEFWGPLV